MLVAVVSATGSQGTAVINTLAAEGHNIRALVRNASAAKAQEIKAKKSDKIDLVEATLDDVASLEKAFRGVDAIYAYTPDGPGEIQQGKNIADAALAAKAGLLIWSTGLNVQAVTDGKIVGCDMLENKEKVDQYIKKLGLNHVFVRCGDFYENILKFGMVQYDKETDQINIIMGGYKSDTVMDAAYIGRDLGKVISTVLNNPARFKPEGSSKPSAYFPKTEKENDYVHFASDRYSFQKLSDTLEKHSGKKVNLISTEPFYPGLELLQQFIREYHSWGKDSPLPDPKLTSLGLKTTSYETFVIEEVIPFLGLTAQK